MAAKQHVLLGGPPGGKAILWCLAYSWRSLERWTADTSLASCVSIRAAARLGCSLSVGDFGFRVSGDCSIIVSIAVAILSVLVSSLEVLDGSVG